MHLVALAGRLRVGRRPADVLAELDALKMEGVAPKREADVRRAVEDARTAIVRINAEPDAAAMLLIRAGDALERAGEHAAPRVVK